MERPYGLQWYTSKTGSWLRPKSTAYLTQTVASTLAPTVSGLGLITIVVDRDDSVEVAGRLGRACRRSGRFVVHTSPRLQAVARLQCELLRAVGKHWDRTAQGGDAPLGQLTRAWLHAERARDLIVLRAHQVSGPALRWLLDLAATDGLRLWLITPRPLPEITTEARGATIRGASPTDATTNLRCDHDAGHHGCEDLNQPASATPPGIAAATRPAMRTARLLRQLYDLEAAALATGAVLMGCPDPDKLAIAGIEVAADASTVATAQASVLAIPEYAQALLRSWAGQPLLPPAWARDAATAYWTLQLEHAQRHSGVRLLDPNLPQLPRIAWHERHDPGAQRLAWLTRSRWLAAANRQHSRPGML